MPSSPIRQAAVLGAGTMGAAIAAHLANAGIPTLLLDLPTDGKDRNAVARGGLGRAMKAKPASFMDTERAALITVGNFEDDFAKLAEADWIEEAIVEKLDAKRAMWERVEKVAKPTAILSSNSSGIPMHDQIEGRSDDFRRRFVGAHFFNPPRWLHLLELIPTTDTDPAVFETLRDFGDRVLGKGIVRANDVPGFVGNRVGVYAMLQAVRTMEKLKLTSDVVDALTGPILGRPKSATLRTADVTGLDVLHMVATGLAANTTGEDFTLPSAIVQMVERKHLGEKTGKGFYQRVKDVKGKSQILTLNFETSEYEARPPVELPELAPIVKTRSALERTRMLLALDTPAGEFTRQTIYEMLRFAAEKVGVVAAEPREIDHALKWGFGWELGAFELIDGLGIKNVAEGIEKQGGTVPAIIQTHLQSGQPFYPKNAEAESDPAYFSLAAYKAAHPAKVVKASPGASLVDIGDGALLLEFHSKANAMGDDAIAMMRAAIDGEVQKGFAGLVVGNEGQHFSAGANLAAMLQMGQEKRFDDLDKMISGFQSTVVAMRTAPFPVVAAGFGMALGGGCETLLASDLVQAHAELYCGLVELGVGLIPAGGGTTEMLIRFTQALPPGADLFEAAKRAFELIAMGKVSSSAVEARRLGFLRETDHISMNKRRLLADAKAAMLALARDYVAPSRRKVWVGGEAVFANLKFAAQSMKLSGMVSEYDVHLATGLARILSGGTLNHRAEVDEQLLLDLEREVFLELTGQPKTQERIAHMLKVGKPLRN